MNHSRAAQRRRQGIVLPLALLVLLAIALFSALLYEYGVEELRSARSEIARVRAMSVMNGALADLIRNSVDSGLLAMRVGASRRASLGQGTDSATVSLQAIGGSLFRLTAVGSVISGPARARSGVVAFVRLVADSISGTRAIRLRPVPGSWRSPFP